MHRFEPLIGESARRGAALPVEPPMQASPWRRRSSASAS